MCVCVCVHSSTYDSGNGTDLGTRTRVCRRYGIPSARLFLDTPKTIRDRSVKRDENISTGCEANVKRSATGDNRTI